MIASVLKQDPNAQKVKQQTTKQNKKTKQKQQQKTVIIRTKTQSANVRGNPFYQARKRHLNLRSEAVRRLRHVSPIWPQTTERSVLITQVQAVHIQRTLLKMDRRGIFYKQSSKHFFFFF